MSGLTTHKLCAFQLRGFATRRYNAELSLAISNRRTYTDQKNNKHHHWIAMLSRYNPDRYTIQSKGKGAPVVMYFV